MPPSIQTIRQHIAWSYANLGMAHTALDDGAEQYGRVHYAIRVKLFNGLADKTCRMGSLSDDERLKMTAPQACCYCGNTSSLSLDHLIPRIKGGSDSADNLVWACKSCNSSKQGNDLLVWMKKRSVFPSILLLRRYIKLVACYCEHQGIMELDINCSNELGLPFELNLLPYKFPPLGQLNLWIYPPDYGKLNELQEHLEK